MITGERSNDFAARVAWLVTTLPAVTVPKCFVAVLLLSSVLTRLTASVRTLRQYGAWRKCQAHHIPTAAALYVADGPVSH